MEEKDQQPSPEEFITVSIIVFGVVVALLGAYIGSWVDWYSRFLNWVYSKNWDSFIRAAKIVFSLGNIILVAGIIFVLRRYQALKKTVPEKKEMSQIHVIRPQKEVAETWSHIRDLANSENPSDWNMAVLRADALFEDILQHLGYEAETMAERLKIADSEILPSLDKIWSAHRLRNMIAHDPMEQHTRETIIYALRAFEQGLKELGMMEETKTISTFQADQTKTPS